MRLEQIGFYTLSDYRASQTSLSSPWWRCELLLTDKCNFKCPYCRGLKEHLGGNLDLNTALKIIDGLINDGLKNIRFSGGEPTLYPNLRTLIKHCKNRIERIAISTNGSADLKFYKYLIDDGVNDFSISLDSCCSSVGEKMNGGFKGWERTIENIIQLSKITYVTVGVVFTKENIKQAIKCVLFASRLGVSDIRVITSAQYNKGLKKLEKLHTEVTQPFPILRYRINNMKNGRNVRGISDNDTNKCWLVLDDIAIVGGYHFPCIIYLREQGNPIGVVSKEMRIDRLNWLNHHNTHLDKICKENCLDVCIDYNNLVAKFKSQPKLLNVGEL